MPAHSQIAPEQVKHLLQFTLGVGWPHFPQSRQVDLPERWFSDARQLAVDEGVAPVEEALHCLLLARTLELRSAEQRMRDLQLRRDGEPVDVVHDRLAEV